MTGAAGRRPRDSATHISVPIDQSSGHHPATGTLALTLLSGKSDHTCAMTARRTGPGAALGAAAPVQGDGIYAFCMWNASLLTA